MRAGFLSDPLERFDPDEMYVDDEAGDWVRCPDCGSEDAGFIYWGEGVDMDFHCPDCGESHGVR